MKKIIVAIPIFCLILIGLYAAFPEKVLDGFISMNRSDAGMERKSVQVGTDEWVYLDGGTGPVLVLVHGFGGNKDNWTLMAKYLTPHYRVIAPDLLGFGDSDKPTDRNYSIRSQAEGLQRFLRALDIKRFHIGGNSMGGAISTVYAARWAEEVESVWLLAPGGVETEAKSEFRQILEAGGENPLVLRNPDDVQKLMNFTMSKAPPIPPLIDKVAAERIVANQAMHDQIFADLIADDSAIVMLSAGIIPDPTLIVWGDEDRVLHPDGAKVLDERIPDSEAILMPGIGHVPMYEAPQQVAEDYLAFRKTIKPPLVIQ